MVTRLIKLFYGGKPELPGAISEKEMFYENPRCRENSEMLRKPELLGAVGDGSLISKSLLPPEQLTRATTLPQNGYEA